MDNRDNFQILPPFEVFYIHSMKFNSNAALNAFQNANSLIEKINANPNALIKLQDNILDYMQVFVNYSGSLSRYFFPSAIGSKNKEIHENRANFLREIFQVDENNPLSNKQLRNAIEHFDERLDIYLRSGVTGVIFPSIISGEPPEGGLPVHVFRAFYIRDSVFQILNEKYQIQPILKEVVRIDNILSILNRNGRLRKIS